MRVAETRQVTCVEHKRFHPQTRNANIQRWADTYLCRTRRECDILLAALKEKMERMISTDDSTYGWIVGIRIRNEGGEMKHLYNLLRLLFANNVAVVLGADLDCDGNVSN